MQNYSIGGMVRSRLLADSARKTPTTLSGLKKSGEASDHDDFTGERDLDGNFGQKYPDRLGAPLLGAATVGAGIESSQHLVASWYDWWCCRVMVLIVLIDRGNNPLTVEIAEVLLDPVAFIAWLGVAFVVNVELDT